MKYIKKYEDHKSEPKVGDYVAVNITNDSAISKELNSKIGKIERRQDSESYIIRFGTISFHIKKENIVDWSENKEDLLHIISGNKYNL